MKNLKSVLVFVLSLILITVYSVTAVAATKPKISLSNVTAAAGESVKIEISIKDNPGIMAMTFSIKYDSKVFEHIGDTNGFISKSYTIKNHPDKGHISFVDTETKDLTNDGVILSVDFKIKGGVAAGKYPITLENHDWEKNGNKLNNCFANSKLDYIVPTISAGSITIPETCENSGHKYGEWKIVTNADCTTTGVKEHTCLRCEFSEEDIIPITHDFEAEWTIDKAATPDTDGEMSRHCKNCDEVTDKIKFSYEEIEDDNDTPDDNTSTDEPSGDNTSSDNNSTNDNSSTDNTSSNTSSTDKPSSNVDTSASSDSAQSGNKPSTNEKPNINNTPGEKVPLQEVEKLEDYQRNIDKMPQKDELSDDNNSNPTVSSQTASTSSSVVNSSASSDKKPSGNTSSTASNTLSSRPSSVVSDVNSSTSSKTDSDTINSNDWLDESDESSFFGTPTGIMVIIVCSLISIGIITLGIILILKNKKQ